jgi:hypothetical protein
VAVPIRVFGALLDIAAASQGVNTQREFTNQGARSSGR